MDWATCLEDGVATIACVPILFKNLINVALIFSGSVTLAFIIIAGYKLINSGGDQKKVADAKATLTWALVGLIIILCSFAIVNFISYLTGVDCIRVIGIDNCK